MELPDSVRLKLNGTFERQLYLLGEKLHLSEVHIKCKQLYGSTRIGWKVAVYKHIPGFHQAILTSMSDLLEYISCQAGKGENFYRHIDDPEAILDCEDLLQGRREGLKRNV